MQEPGSFDQEKWRAEALEAFPYEIKKVPGRDALNEWALLRKQEGLYPVVVGGDAELVTLLEPFHPSYYGPEENTPSVKSILTAAEGIRHPEGLRAYLKEQEELAGSYPEEEYDEPEIGKWPLFPPKHEGLSVAYDVLSAKPLPHVNIVLLPTDDWTEAPAYLRWGNWNDNPPPEYHVAALRSWRDRYGAELVGMSHDVMNIRVEKRPKTREEALNLAREQYDYCYDIVDQGVGTLAPLAAMLKAHDWWYFWWD